jgi:hypothetical protein
MDSQAQSAGGDDLHDTTSAGDVRVERIREHVDDSLKQSDALEATVGAASGDLMLMQYRLRQALDDALEETPNSLAAIAEVMPAMNTFLKLSQQVGQFVQLSLKIKTAKNSN